MYSWIFNRDKGSARMNFLKQNARHVSTIAFICGFISDTLTLRRVDLWVENAVLTGYLLLAAICIIAGNAKKSRLVTQDQNQEPKKWSLSLIIMQFSFGGLFSAFFIFYSRSASLILSWPFLLILLLLLVGNELAKSHYSRLTLQISMFFFASFSYAIFLLPIVVHAINDAVFILSGLTSILILALILFLLSWKAPERYLQSRRAIMMSAACIYVSLNILYFMNVIPPIPLALKDIGIYHSIVREENGNYAVQKENVSWYNIPPRLYPVFLRFENEPVYVYSAVFAPIKLEITILHEWSYFDETIEEWRVASVISFPIEGGRDGGYRGYSLKENLKKSVRPEQWRVDVKTDKGKILGRISFTIIDVPTPPLLTRQYL